MNTLTNPHSRRAARTLALFALIGIAAVSLAWLALNARITQAQRNAELALYRELDPDITTLPPTQPIELNGIAAQYQKSARTHFLRASTHKGYNGNSWSRGYRFPGSALQPAGRAALEYTAPELQDRGGCAVDPA